MSQLRTVEVPTVMKHGLGAINALADEVRSLGLKRPMLVTDPGCARAGLLEQAQTPLRAANLDADVFDRVAPNPGIALVDEGAAVYMAEGCDAVNRLIEDVDIPTLQEMGFSEDETPMLARIAFEDPQTVGNPRDLTEAAYVGIYERAFERGRK